MRPLPMPMRMLTVKQPWASAIMSGAKGLENRTWKPSIEGPFYLVIHAGKSLDRGVTAQELRDAGWDDAPDDLGSLPRGAILGVVLCDGADVVAMHEGNPWAVGPFCWRVKPVMVLDQPIPAMGALGLLRLDATLEDELRGMLPKSR